MQPDTFQAGVAPGGAIRHIDVKLLICHALAALDAPAGFQLLLEALRASELVNYFALVEALEQLVGTGLLHERRDDAGEVYYQLSGTGRAMISELSGSLPRSLRDKSAAAIRRAHRRGQRLSEIEIGEEPAGGGYILRLTIPEESLFELSLFVPDREQRDIVRRNFLNNPVHVYRSVLSLLAEPDVFPPDGEEPLFP